VAGRSGQTLVSLKRMALLTRMEETVVVAAEWAVAGVECHDKMALEMCYSAVGMDYSSPSSVSSSPSAPASLALRQSSSSA